VQIIEDDTTVHVNGLICARHDSLVWMNYGPGGPNTVGRLKTDEGPPLGTAENGKLPCNDPPKSSPWLEKLQKLKEQLKGIDPDQMDQIVRIGETSKMLDEQIAKIDVKDDGTILGKYGNWKAQETRAILGFGKDIALGLSQLLYSASKLANPAGLIHTQLDNLILAENIKLGNICDESVKQAAKGVWDAVKKPVTDPWDKGNYVEAVTRGILEVGSLALAVGDLAKLGKAGQLSKAAEAGNAAKPGELVKPPEPVKQPEAPKPPEAPAGENGVKIEAKFVKPKGKYWRMAPNSEEWIKKGGKIEELEDGSVRYTNKNGESVVYDPEGKPDFTPHLDHPSGVTELPVDGLTGNRDTDNLLSNRAVDDMTAGTNNPTNWAQEYGRSAPPGYTWHHVPGGSDMQLVPSDIHGEFTHTGGASDINSGVR
jgi:hypothetical protein